MNPGSIQQTGRAVEKEEQRAITASMSELAATCGDLESELRRLARRISDAIPGGSPFEMIDKGNPSGPGTRTEVAPCRSHMTDELQARIYQLRQLATTVGSIVERIEL